MATPGDVAELRGELTRLREQVEAVSASEAGARAQLEAELQSCKAHTRAVGEKMEEDIGAVQFQMAELKEMVQADRLLVLEATAAIAAIAAANSGPQTSAVSVGPKSSFTSPRGRGSRDCTPTAETRNGRSGASPQSAG